MNYIIEERDIIKSGVPSEWREQIDHFYVKLKSEDDKKRDLIASIFARYVSAQSRELSAEVFSKFIKDINELILNLINGPSTSEKLGGLSVIDALAREEYTESSNQINRMASYLHNLFILRDSIVVKKAATVLGNLTKNNTGIFNDLLEKELNCALEWLDDFTTSGNSFAALNVLNQLALNASSLFYIHMGHFFKSIWNGLLSKDTLISFAAAETLNSALCILVPRDINNNLLHRQWYEDLYTRSISAFETPTLAGAIHGSLLVLCEMLKTAKNFMNSRFYIVCDMALKYWNNPNKLTRSLIIKLIGILAEFNPNEFSQKYLSTTMNLFLHNFKKESFGLEILSTIGILSRATGSEIKPYLKEILKFIVQISNPKNRRLEFADKVLTCISSLSYAIKADFISYTGYLLDLIFSLPFSPALVDCLLSLISEMPSLTLEVQIRLMNLISLILMHKPFAFLSKNKFYAKTIRQSTPIPTHNLGANELNSLVSLSLRTLNTFPFPNVFLIYFLQEITTRFLRDRTPLIRLEAVTTCCELTSKLIKSDEGTSEGIMEFLTPILTDLFRNKNNSNVFSSRNKSSLNFSDSDTLGSSVFAWISRPDFQVKNNDAYHFPFKTCKSRTFSTFSHNGIYLCGIFNYVLKNLLNVAVTDLDPNIRYAVLSHMEPKFDTFLAQIELLEALFITLNDEHLQIRSESIKILCRLNFLNPARIGPVLRRRFLQLLSEMDYYNGGLSKEINTRQLNQFITEFVQLAQQYSSRILKALIIKAHDSDSRVSAHAMDGLSKLARVTNLFSYLKTLLPLIIECLQDQSSQNRRRASLITLGTLIQTTGYVIDPLIKYPHLLDLLISMFNTEPSDIRHVVIRTLGILGALDPERQRKSTLKAQKKRKTLANKGNLSENTGDLDLSALTLGSSSEEYYAIYAINALLNILRRPSLFMHHQNAVQAIMSIFKSLGMNSIPYLNGVVPVLLRLLFGGEVNFKMFLFQNLALLVSIVKQYIREYLNEIFAMIKEFWHIYDLIYNIATLIEEIVLTLNDEFRIYMPIVIPLILNVYNSENIEILRNTIRLSQTLRIIGTLLDEYQHLLLPRIISLIEIKYLRVDYKLVLNSIRCIGWLSLKLSLEEVSSQIIHSLLRTINFVFENQVVSEAKGLSDNSQTNIEHGDPHEIFNEAVHTICLLMCQLSSKYLIFQLAVNQVLNNLNIVSAKYKMLEEVLVSDKVVREETIASFLREASSTRLEWPYPSSEPPSVEQKLKVSEKTLRIVLDISQRSTKEDWAEWIRRFSIEILRDSPSIALRSCLCVSDYLPLVRTLFNPAFLSCWKELCPKTKEDLVRALETALLSDSIPKEILQILLDLTEFMEHGNQSLPIDIHKLYTLAVKCRAYAKALRYKEMEYRCQSDNVDVIESLIILNTKLSLSSQATGILRVFKMDRSVEFPVSCYEKLGNWEDALKFYSARMHVDHQCILGKMKCLNVLGEWNAILDECWAYFDPNVGGSNSHLKIQITDDEVEIKNHLALIASSAAWYVQDWEKMAKFVENIRNAPVDKAFFGAILAISNEDFENAKHLIFRAREAIETELKALFGESYQRAYKKLIRVQQLSELEEVMEYKQSNFERRNLLRYIWNRRLGGCQKNLEVWRRLLAVRAIVIPAQYDFGQWLEYAKLARKCRRLRLARNVLNHLSSFFFKIGGEGNPTLNKDENFSHYFGPLLQGDVSVELLNKDPFIKKILDMDSPLLKDIELSSSALYLDDELSAQKGSSSPSNSPANVTSNISMDLNRIFFSQIKQKWSEGKKQCAQQLLKIFSHTIDSRDHILLAEASYKMARWIQLSNETLDENLLNATITGYLNATKYNPNWYKAFHFWALINYDMVQKILKSSSIAKSKLHLPTGIVNAYLLPAISGFFRSIDLNPKHNLQDVLRLLNLWFNYGTDFRVQSSLLEGCSALPVDVWLPVIPQIMARLFSLHAGIQSALNTLLARIAKKRPQAIVYAITMAKKSQNPKKSEMAWKIILKMREYSSVLIDEAELVSQELIGVAVLSHENWYNAIEEASRLYFNHRDFEGMVSLLAPLHETLNKTPETQRDINFKQTFGKELQEAQKWCQKYSISRNESDISRAWDIYYHVFLRIGRLPNIIKLDLESVSPKLSELHDLELAVPGTYKAKKPIVRIKKFYPMLRIIASKQRPRRLIIIGSDGLGNHFLLKGHEDLRQDERVMQFFGLVNFLLRKNTRTQFVLGPQTDLSIQRYSVIPFNTSTGLLTWVPHCDTLHQLIKEYRTHCNVPLNSESHHLLQLTENYDDLTYMQKVEIFQSILDSFAGDDLEKILWLKSSNSEIWLQRRSNFTTSLAVMSIVGYILGLGDRHPSNIMLDKYTGKVIHIDFGDCFEVTLHREKYPEKVPFRLTRMLVKSLDISGVEGSFRIICENVMEILRENHDDLMAVLEAFVYDPLINWRLLTPAQNYQMTSRIENSFKDEMPITRPNFTAFSVINSSGNRSYKKHGISPEDGYLHEEINEKALNVVNRVMDKLNGRDFDKARKLDVGEQVSNLIKMATNKENLSRAFLGWVGYW